MHPGAPLLAAWQDGLLNLAEPAIGGVLSPGRILGALRSSSPALRSRESYFYYLQSLQGTAVVAYHRHAPATATAQEQYAMVVLNFTGLLQTGYTATRYGN